jgi:hypothetical protein
MNLTTYQISANPKNDGPIVFKRLREKIAHDNYKDLKMIIRSIKGNY